MIRRAPAIFSWPQQPGQPSRLLPGPGPVTPARAPARGCQRRPFSPDAGSRPKTGSRRLPAGLPAIPLPLGQAGNDPP
jgi:hypothetical protein